jgi:hypothetical protein
VSSSLAAARRGAELIKKFPAFARQATLDPVGLDIDALVAEAEGWVSRTIPSRIETETRLQDGCWHVLLDPASLHSAVVNAKDATPPEPAPDKTTSPERATEAARFPDVGDHVKISLVLKRGLRAGGSGRLSVRWIRAMAGRFFSGGAPPPACNRRCGRRWRTERENMFRFLKVSSNRF